MKDNAVLIDTSIWIEYFRESSKEVAHQVDSLLENDLILLPKIVLAELLQGTLDKKEQALLKNHLELIPQISETKDTWEKAGLLSFEIKKKGYFANLSDCYIAMLAMEAKASIYSLDKHFKILSKHLNLRLYTVS